MGIVKTEKLNIGYNQVPVLKDVNIDVESGEVVTLIGPNGSGKTTLLKTIASILESVDGSVFISGKELSALSDKERSKIMSVMLTEKKSYDYITCGDVVRVGRYPYTGVIGKIGIDDERIIKEIMTLTGVIELSEREFDKISDGQRQRVLLARALVQEPKILLLDEPTSFLDVGYKIEFMTVLKKLCREKKIGVLMSLHELDLAAAVSDRVITISVDGSVDKVGNPKDILTADYIAELFGIKQGKYSVKEGFSLGDNYAHTGASVEINEDVVNREFDGENNSGKKNTHYIMIQGTMSNAGKSLVTAALCRIFKQDGYKVAPFKSQNMALNSFVTEDGLEMGRAQVMQAEAAGIAPDVHMNPILLKPTDDQGSQVIVNGKVIGNMRAKEYFEYKTSLVPDIKEALSFLEERFDIIVIEGAGSPAEINLKKNDIVNMGIAKLTNSPVLLVGDIDRGGVFAQLLGTIELLENDEKALVKGLIVNKFRGDKSILDSGITMLEERGGKPVVGVLPYMDLNLEDEDSLSERFIRREKGLIDVCVIRLPHISNFTDFDVFEQFNEVSVRYVKNPREVIDADLVIIPGSKNTIADMKWLRENGFEAVLTKRAMDKKPIFGICGGYQMLGVSIEDPDGVEIGSDVSVDRGGIDGGNSIDVRKVKGLGLLEHITVLQNEKCRRQVDGELGEIMGIFSSLSHKKFYGYEIHMGKSVTRADIQKDYAHNDACDSVLEFKDNVYGTYVHGFFDNDEIVKAIVETLAKEKGVEISSSDIVDYRSLKEREYDRLSDTMRQYLDMDKIYEVMGIKR